MKGMWRQGDVLIRRIEDGVPECAERCPDLVLARGEASGHAHRVAEAGGAALFRDDDELYLVVTGGRATVTHEEHAAIELPGPATYHVWRQREYNPLGDAEVDD